MSVSGKIIALLFAAGLLVFCVFAHGRQEASDGVRYRAEIARLEAEFAGLRSRVASARGEAECWLAGADSESASQVLRLLDDLSDPVCESGSGAAFSVGDEVRLDAAPCIDVTVIEVLDRDVYLCAGAGGGRYVRMASELNGGRR